MSGCTQGARKPRSSPHTSMLVARISTGSVLAACSRQSSSCACDWKVSLRHVKHHYCPACSLLHRGYLCLQCTCQQHARGIGSTPTATAFMTFGRQPDARLRREGPRGGSRV